MGVVLHGKGRVAGEADELVATGSNAEEAPGICHCLQEQTRLNEQEI